jgi:hypothetical protein
VRMKALVAVALAAAAALAPDAHAGQGPERTGLGLRLLEAPSERRDDPRARTYVIDHVAPGTEFSRKFEVSNDTGASAQVSLYPAAAEVANGSFSAAPGRAANELTGWMSVTPQVVELDHGERVTAVVTYRVPPDASPGERYAAVMAELAPARASGGMLVSSRVGIRTYLGVGEGGEPASDFVVDSLAGARNAQGAPVVRATVRNTGGRALDMSGELRLLAGPGGLTAGPFPAKLGTTPGIGQSSPVEVVLDRAFPAGPWTVRIELQSGLVRRTAKAVISFPEQPGAVGPAAVATAVPLTEDPDVVIPVAIGLLAAVAVLLLGHHVLRRRRAPARQAPALPRPRGGTPAAGEHRKPRPAPAGAADRPSTS